jgi:hypothetical protein
MLNLSVNKHLLKNSPFVIDIKLYQPVLLQFIKSVASKQKLQDAWYIYNISRQILIELFILLLTTILNAHENGYPVMTECQHKVLIMPDIPYTLELI